MKQDVIIVGAGLSGLAAAEVYLYKVEKKVNFRK
jgi:flavin-dependent dehydrogenase